MRSRFILLVMVMALPGLSGCAGSRHQCADSTWSGIVALDGRKDASREWKLEAQKRFKDPVIVTVHGQTLHGEWYCFPRPPHDPIRVETLARAMHALYPKNDVVLVCCNEDGHAIHIPHVWNARHKLWVRPDAVLFPWERTQRAGRAPVGDIWQFVN